MNNGPAWNKGKKFPHSKEWTLKRLEASRKAMEGKVWKRGYARPKEHTQPMLDALKLKMKSDPEKYRSVSISNLPKDVNGSKNGNWKGGVTAKNRGIRFSKEYRHWRKSVIERDGKKCKLCGDVEKLSVHHIIPMSECLAVAFVPMNGVVLCKKCHYDNDEAWQGKRFPHTQSIGKTLALIFTIPHKFQTYSTVGNWQFNENGVPVIFVSSMGNWRYEALVGLHELVEALLCKERGITTAAVDKFDKAFEKARKPGDESEPGDDPKAPYRKEHFFATNIESLMSAELGVNWQKYEAAISKLP